MVGMWYFENRTEFSGNGRRGGGIMLAIKKQG